MKHRLCIFLSLCCLLVMAGCRRIVLPEEGGQSQSDEVNYNSNAPVVDRDDEGSSDDTGDVVGAFRGYETLREYLEVYGSVDKPIPLEDVLPGGCLYQVIMQNGNISGIENCWVEGYVVGYINGTTWKKAVIGNTDAVPSNIVLAAKPDEADMARCFPVQLSQASVDQRNMREALNLKDNPDMLGKLVCLAGVLSYYMHTLGLTQVYDGYYDDGNPEDNPQPDDPEPVNPDPDDPTPDDPDPEPDDPSTPDGPYHGYSSVSDYLTAFSQSADHTAPLEDFFEGGCVYEDITTSAKKRTEWAKKPIWIKGYIVGVAAGEDGKLEGIFEGDWTGINGYQHDTNILLAPTADTKDVHQCVPVFLSNENEIRKKLNLYKNPSNKGREIAVKGKVSYYYSTAGIQETSEYHFFE
ncbi:MAG: DUF6359 domain-containing protein [Bacteroidales bacterium]|nr:DUF6359 domain-containing protein [Bacteroidales bacterium]